jgi:hypothetical protein
MEKMVKCKACGREIAKSAKICPGCGKKQTKSAWKVIGITALCLGLIIAIGDGISASSGKGSSSSSSSAPTQMTLAQYKTKAVSLAYRKAMLKEYKDDTPVKISGTITDKDSDTRFLVSTGDMENYVLIDFDEAPKVVKGDVIEVYGNYNGTESYTTVLGSDNEVPLISGKYVQVIQESN